MSASNPTGNNAYDGGRVFTLGLQSFIGTTDVPVVLCIYVVYCTVLRVPVRKAALVDRPSTADQLEYLDSRIRESRRQFQGEAEVSDLSATGELDDRTLLPPPVGANGS